MKLPDVTAITSLDEAKQIIEQLFQLYEQQRKEILQLQEEIARLKKQPKRPQFGSSQQISTTPTQLLKENGKHWHKSSRKPIEIDRHEQLPEIAICACGSTAFRTIKTTTKIVQGLVINRNNTAYHGKKK